MLQRTYLHVYLYVDSVYIFTILNIFCRQENLNSMHWPFCWGSNRGKVVYKYQSHSHMPLRLSANTWEHSIHCDRVWSQEVQLAKGEHMFTFCHLRWHWKAPKLCTLRGNYHKHHCRLVWFWICLGYSVNVFVNV